jgi:CHAT domain-containing protein/Tfp pilus assembly protein PilF
MTAAPAAVSRIGVAIFIVMLCAGNTRAQDADLVRANALNQQIVELYRQGRYDAAVPAAKEALAIRERALGPGHPDVATSLINLADLYRAQSRYAEALPLYQRGLTIFEKAVGPDHPNVATSLNNLAELYRAQGRYPDAEPLYKRSLAIREKALGPDHAAVAASLNNLALLYRAQGRYPDAEPLYKRGLTIFEKALGPDHPNVATSLNNLAELYRAQGRYPDAEPLYKRSLAIREKALGPDHAAVAASLINLADLYRAQSRYAEALTLYQRGLAIREKALGPDHPDIAAVLNNLAGVYFQSRAQGGYSDAESLYKRSLAIREKALGPDHPDVAQSLSNLALLYDDRGRFTEAESLYKRSLAIREKALGPDHPDVAENLNNLAGLCWIQGRYAEVEPLYERSLAIREKALGPDHPWVAQSLNNVAALYDVEGRYAEAEPLYKRSLAIWEKALGPDHPDVTTALNNLAVLYRIQGRTAEAEPFYKRSLAIREKTLGPDHPDVGTSLVSLADLYRDQGRYAEAEPLYKRSLAIREKGLGLDHRDVASSLNGLALLYDNQGRYAEAEPLYKRSLAIREKALGPDNDDVAATLNNLAELYRAQGRTAEALGVGRRAVAILGKRLIEAGAARGDANAERRKQRVYFVNNVRLVDEVGAADAATESFRVAQFAATSIAAEALAGMAARFAAGSDALAAVVRERQDLARRRQLLDAAIVAAASRPPDRRDAAAETELREQLGAAATALDALDSRLAREFPAYAELANPKPLELAEAQALLAPDEAMLVYLTGPDRSWLWAVRRDRAGFLRLDIGGNTLSAEITALRARLDPTRNLDLAPFDTGRAFALYERILAPATALLDGAQRVFVIPDGALESLPFGVLVMKRPAHSPDQPADHREITWLARDYAVIVLPSVSALQGLRQYAAAGHTASAFVGIGDPVLEGKSSAARGVKLASLFRGALADVDAVRQLPSLPETAVELRAVGKEMGAGEQDLYLAERASEPVLRKVELDRYRIVEFATHGLMSGDLKGLSEPALVLTPPEVGTPDNDGLLTASKVATLKLNADWVVLSACNTAASDGTPDAGGLSGLAKAFFYAGARSLLVSHWSVPSEATVRLITGAFDQLKKDPTIGRAEALRRAEMAMLDPESPPEYAHPMFWAPFILAGEGGAGR